jgi:hypothetical protein
MGYLVEDSEGILHYVKQSRDPYAPTPKGLWELFFGSGQQYEIDDAQCKISGFDWTKTPGMTYEERFGRS